MSSMNTYTIAYYNRETKKMVRSNVIHLGDTAFSKNVLEKMSESEKQYYLENAKPLQDGRRGLFLPDYIEVIMGKVGAKHEVH